MPSQDGAGRDQSVATDIDTRLLTKSIMQTLDTEPEFSRAAEAFRRAGLDARLSAAADLTVFAPVDGSGDEESLRQNILARPVTEAELRRSGKFKTAAGRQIPVVAEDGFTRVGSTRIVRADIQCTNGVLHITEARL
jgi:uncharacterized surface protein with fasciclin (FAS1) repeats